MSFDTNEHRVLTLRSYDINASNTASVYFNTIVTTPAGEVADNRMSLCWNNVNLRQLMGDSFYDKFDKFHIRLNTLLIGQTQTAVLASQTAASTDARSVVMYLSGLAFDPAPYNQGSATKSAGRVQFSMNVLPQIAATAGLGVGQVNVYAIGQSPSYTFSKTADSPTIKIHIVQQSNQQPFVPAADTSLYGHMDFIFEIHGVAEAETMTRPDRNLISAPPRGNFTYTTPASDFKDKTLFR
jgi:hypothetical protein